MENFYVDSEVMLQWNEDIESDLSPEDFLNTVIFARDWTVETIVNQIVNDNIDLNPAFQRRNAWSDEKRSLLIESFLMGVPVPQIVLAENLKARRKFLILDGKQRLMTLIGFFMPDKFPYWKKPVLNGLDVMSELNGRSGSDILSDPRYSRLINNADVRTSVISNYSSDDILYSIFYRINSGSVPLSTQELRQSLFPGDFTKSMIQATENRLPIHDILGIDKGLVSDDKFRDTEMLLHYLSFKYFFEKYQGNLKKFLDHSLGSINSNWSNMEDRVISDIKRFSHLCERMIHAFGNPKAAARKYNRKGSLETAFNKSIFDALIYFFDQISESEMDDLKNQRLREGYKKAFDSQEFRASVESTTKSKENYKIRYEVMATVFESAYGRNFNRPLI